MGSTTTRRNRKSIGLVATLIVVAVIVIVGSALLNINTHVNHDRNNVDGRSMMMDLITDASTTATATASRGLRLLRSAKSTTSRRRQLQTFDCPKTPHPPPQYPPLPTLQQATYAASFPGSGDRMITKYLVESMTGLFVGEAEVSPSLIKMQALDVSNGGGGRTADMGKGQGEVVVVRTSFPHSQGKLASWDNDIPRAFVILRSPLHAIPAYFNRLHELKYHLPTGSATHPEHVEETKEAWLKWRDNQLHSQTMLYRRFVSFWMEKYLGDEGNRLYFDYETFIDPELGPAEAVRLAQFLEEGMKASAMEWSLTSMEHATNAAEVTDKPQPFDQFLKGEGGVDVGPEKAIDRAMKEAMKTLGNVEDVPCLWKEIVYDTVRSAYREAVLPEAVAAAVGVEEGGRMRRALQEEQQETPQKPQEGGEGEEHPTITFDGGDWNPDIHPLTPENLMGISQMLLELMNRWSRHQRLLTIMSKYHRGVNRAYLEMSGTLDAALKEREELDKRAEQQKQQQQQAAKNDVDAPSAVPAAAAAVVVTKPEEPPPKLHPFHIIQASPPNTASTVAANWLIGLFEPEKDIAFMDNWPEKPVRQSGQDATIDSTIVTKTNNLELLTMYKLIRPHFEEVFFVVSNRGTDPQQRVNADICSYKNVLCLEYEDLAYNNQEELHAMVRAITEKFRKRFEYYFGKNNGWLAVENELNAVERLDAMARIVEEMSDKPKTQVDLKFGVYGGYHQFVAPEVSQEGNSPDAANPVDRRHRRLSIALPDGGCKITWPQPPKTKIQTAYAASYPGCGARMSWNLVEALTGLWTGDDWDNNNRGHRVVTVKTHYPHDAGKLVEWDNEINRALVIIRNPMNAIPSFFNHIYEIKNNLKIHSERAPVSDWIEWRDRLALNQINKYAKFVNYWMERFDQSDQDRIFISYETLTDDIEGPAEAIRITNFLSKSEGVEPISTDAVPCVWKAVVKYKEQVSDPNRSERRRRLDPKHHDSQRSGPTERPYTPELLDAMSKMLLDLIERWGDRHLRLRKTLEGYHQIVHAAYLDISNQSPKAVSLQSSSKKFHIIQVSPLLSGSTVLNNLLLGLLDPEAEYEKSSMVSITHEMSGLLNIYKDERAKYDEVFFVVSNKGSARVANDQCAYDNVLCIEYEELQYSNQQELNEMVNNLANKLSSRFKYYFGRDLFDYSEKSNAVKRIEAMDSVKTSVRDASSQGGARFEVNGKSFHIFQASSQEEAQGGNPGSVVVTNWLQGLFEPEKDYSFMINSKDRRVRNHDMTVDLDYTVVTKTHIPQILGLFQMYRPQFDEVLFVVSNRGTNPETMIDASLCEYDNVLCIEDEVLKLSSKLELVNSLTDKFRSRFRYFFGDNSQFLGQDNVASAVRRLEGMSQVALELANQPYSVADPKYGVHGGQHINGGLSSGSASARGRLFYCGGALSLLGKENFKYSTFGLFLAKSLFPEYEGSDIEVISGNKVSKSAIPLTADSMQSASGSDLLIVHSHQHCEVSVEEFPGIQLHINAEYYDMHPKHLDNAKANGALTYNYLPPGPRSFVIGLHEDTSRSIRVPLAAMRLWYLHMSKQTKLGFIFDPQYRPKNIRDNFVLYINSHYIEYRERAARALSEIGTIHTAGKCQGNFEANPPPPGDDSATQCVPFDNDQRPMSIQPITDQLGLDHQHNNMELFSKYRYALVMENADPPGYVSEKILHAFLSGTVPIYFGSRFVFEIFNPKAFIYFDLDIPQQALSQIQFYEQNLAEYEKMLNEPILANGVETIEKYFSWDESVGNGKLKSRIRQMVGLD